MGVRKKEWISLIVLTMIFCLSIMSLVYHEQSSELISNAITWLLQMIVEQLTKLAAWFQPSW